ncbi:MAG: Smr/MutS family protein [Opitutales bacterium]|nr:Smr/MutS family protein [Opitutales bacterium]
MEETEYPVDGTLDLHMFRPKECAEAVEAYLEACAEAGILDVRIIHGKGIGTLREQVRAQLERHPGVADFTIGTGGNWGASTVRLRPLPWDIGRRELKAR